MKIETQLKLAYYRKLLVSNGKLKVEFRLWDLAAAKEMTALAFTTTPSNWKVAHIISDKIYERLTGEEGYFDTRIIYVLTVLKSEVKTSYNGSRRCKYKIFNFGK